jgi:hypothetical protein
VRLYQQSAASFFGFQFPAAQPAMSSDYRLSSFWSWQLGLGFSWAISDTLSFNMAANYLEQTGLDRFQPPAPTVVPLLRPLPLTPTTEQDDTGGEGGAPATVSAADMHVTTITFGFGFKF